MATAMIFLINYRLVSTKLNNTLNIPNSFKKYLLRKILLPHSEKNGKKIAMNFRPSLHPVI